MRWGWAMLAAAAGTLAVPAEGQALRELCTTRPGLGTSACTVDPGHVLIETGLADWARDAGDDGVEKTLLLGDLLARIGLTETSEVQLGLTGYGRVSERDETGIARSHRVGDALIAFRQNLSNPDGSGFSAAIEPLVTLPVGRRPVGAGTWSAGLIVPVDYEFNDVVQLQLSPEVDAAADEDGAGRHLAWGGVVGLDVHLTETAEVDVEIQAVRDHDPGGRNTLLLAGVAAAWQPREDWQLDVGSAFGLNADSPDVRVYAGIVRRF